MVEDALRPEVDNGNIDSVDITLSISNDKINLGVKVGITNSNPVTINLTLNL